ncbi:MAG: hypothetical protein V3W44_01625 [Dehalococcoidales bacterium]
MPKKVRRGKAFQHKKKRMRKPAISTPAASPVSAPVQTPAPAPVSRAAATKTKTPATKYPFVTAELRRIGIFAGAILVILIVLALVL